MKSARELVDEAMAQVVTLAIEEAIALRGQPGAVFVDLRESGELRREGRIPGAVHAPRGMLEFWVDPSSPYFKSALAPEQRLVLFCAAGWRSALAAKALQDMGRDKVCHLGGGFAAWRASGAALELPKSDRLLE